MAIPQYVSITDFTAHAQVRAMHAVFDEAGGHALGLRLAVGVMTSRKIYGDDPDYRFRKVFPEPGQFAEIFAPFTAEELGTCPPPYYVLHYADYEGHGVEIDRHLRLVTKWAGPALDALQLDMVWPDPDGLAPYRRDHPHLPIILQVGRRAMEEVHGDATEMVHRLRPYVEGRLIDAVLLDRSGGDGIDLEPFRLAYEMDLLSRVYRDAVDAGGLGFVLAGGLCAEAIRAGRLRPFGERRYGFSIDAQRKLHVGHGLFQPVDWEEEAPNYLRAGIAFFRELKEMHAGTLPGG